LRAILRARRATIGCSVSFFEGATGAPLIAAAGELAYVRVRDEYQVRAIRINLHLPLGCREAQSSSAPQLQVTRDHIIACEAMVRSVCMSWIQIGVRVAYPKWNFDRGFDGIRLQLQRR